MYIKHDIKVLIVDDDPIITTVFSRVAVGVGLVPLTASTTQEALMAMGDKEADILLLDLSLAGDPGAGDILLDAWLANSLGPVAVLSGYMTDMREAEIITRGAHNALAKPVSIGVLQSILNRYAREVVRDKMCQMVTQELEAVKAEMQELKDHMAKYDKHFRLGLLVSSVVILLVFGVDGSKLINLLFSLF